MAEWDVFATSETRRTIDSQGFCSVKGYTHRVKEAWRWLSMSGYQCIERVHRSVGTLLCCYSGHQLKWLLTEKVFF